MIFDNDSVAFEVLDVFSFDEGHKSTVNVNRNFDALSFRYKADTIIKYNGKELEFTDNSIGFFPANIDYKRITNRDKMIVVHFKSFNYHTDEIEQFYPTNYERYRVLFEKIMKCRNDKNVGYKYEVAALLNLIFAEMYKDTKNADMCNSKIGLSVRYIEDNYLKNDFSLKSAAGKSFISETYFRKLFKQEYGISPKKYIIDLRMKDAASMIAAGYYTLSEISELCGYNDSKYFSTEFKNYYGVSPSKYVCSKM